ncbi:ComF family protein [Sphaerospermopsis aphanizomenoides BCCUSP55]|uniref:ComF family protein n=1 Tax=Sphaerospermopsis aphanizomenoides TaxID=459663 RepID=UPI00190676CF|nr:ComF family protein [Sphaerospermopsis aphanizomenoides]MBK1990953.1 ComF family protein [Sphaerospermopsis aphanizomenoides BCCUSP55]
MFKNLLNLFLQNNCPICQRSTKQQICQYCNKQLQSCHLQNPNHSWKEPLPVFSWGSYGGAVKRAIAVMKYENHPEIGRILGNYLGESWLLNTPSLNKKPVIVPIPLHAKKLKERGYNQAALIAEGFCQTTGLKLQSNGLARIKETKAQFSVSGSEREQNLADAFSLGQDFRRRQPDAPVLLMDDIYTTGATAKSAVYALNQSNISVIGIAAVAATGSR